MRGRPFLLGLSPGSLRTPQYPVPPGPIRCAIGQSQLRDRGGGEIVRHMLPIRIAARVPGRQDGNWRNERPGLRWYEFRRSVDCTVRRRPVFGRNYCRRISVLVDLADEPEPALVQRADEALVIAAVAERAPDRADTRAERRLRDDTTLPNRVE